MSNPRRSIVRSPLLWTALLASVALTLGLLLLNPRRTETEGDAIPSQNAPKSSGERRVAPRRAASPTPAPDSVTIATVSGLVLDERGAPVGAGVEVDVTRLYNQPFESTTATAEDGSFSIEVPRGRPGDSGTARARETAMGTSSDPGRWETPYSGDPGLVVLRLRDMTTVSGRVVDEAGAVVVGASVRVYLDRPGVSPRSYQLSADKWHDETETVTGADGRFAVRLRSGPSGYVAAARTASEVFGAYRSFDVPAGGPCEVGDLVAPRANVTTWNLRFVDDQAVPCRQVRLLLEKLERWNEPDHTFSAESRSTLLDEGGTTTLRFACRERPVVVAAGSVTHATRCLALACREPGAREGTIVLDRRPIARVRLVGTKVDDVKRDQFLVRLSMMGRGGPTTLDVAQGSITYVQYPQGVDSPWTELEDWFGWKLGDHRSESEFTTPVPGAGRYGVQLILSDGESIRARDVEIANATALAEVEIDTSSIPRRVVLDLEALDRWRRSDGTHWASAYAMWFETAEPSTEFERCYCDLLWDRDQVPPIAVADGVQRLAFGFVDFARSMTRPKFPDEVVRVPVTAGAFQRIEVPIPTRSAARTGRVRFVVRRAGRPFAYPGVKIQYRWIPTKSDPDGATLGGDGVVTNSSGEACVRLFPAKYACRVDLRIPGVPRDVPPEEKEIEVRAGDAEMRVELDVPTFSK